VTDREQSVLAANQAFYDAFINNDYVAMEALWATRHDVTVIHPGWAPLRGHGAVLDSWQRILAGEGINTMQCSEARAYLGDGMAFVICHETFPEGELVATNIFALEDHDWKMIHHHSGPASSTGAGSGPDRVH
jgi:ketosteroid isomerase-like protein